MLIMAKSYDSRNPIELTFYHQKPFIIWIKLLFQIYGGAILIWLFAAMDLYGYNNILYFHRNYLMSGLEKMAVFQIVTVGLIIIFGYYFGFRKCLYSIHASSNAYRAIESALILIYPEKKEVIPWTSIVETKKVRPSLFKHPFHPGGYLVKYENGEFLIDRSIVDYKILLLIIEDRSGILIVRPSRDKFSGRNNELIKGYLAIVFAVIFIMFLFPGIMTAPPCIRQPLLLMVISVGMYDLIWGIHQIIPSPSKWKI